MKIWRSAARIASLALGLALTASLAPAADAASNKVRSGMKVMPENYVMGVSYNNELVTGPVKYLAVKAVAHCDSDTVDVTLKLGVKLAGASSRPKYKVDKTLTRIGVSAPFNLCAEGGTVTFKTDGDFSVSTKDVPPKELLPDYTAFFLFKGEGKLEGFGLTP